MTTNPFHILAATGVGGLLLVGVAYVFEKGIVAFDGPIMLFAGVVGLALVGSPLIWRAAQKVTKTAPTRPLGSPTGVDVSDRTLHIAGTWK